jgi:drug/metabolite transporter (DMT)-like permease
MPSGASPLPGSVPERTARSGPRRERLRKATNWAGIALALGATYACFGSSPAGTKAALGSFPPLLIMGVRGCVAGAVLSGWALWTGAERPGRRRVASSLLVGTLILALGSGVGTIGQQTVPSGVVGVLSATMPLLAACLAYALFRERLARRAMVGLAIGFAGIALLLRPGSALDPTGVALVIAAQVAWAFGAVLAPRLRLPADPRLTAGLELLGGGCVLLVAGAASGHFGDLRLHAVSRSSWLGLGWLVLTAVGGFTAYGFLVKRVPTSVSTTFSYVNPMVAIGLGWLLFSEPVTMRMVVATLVLIVGVFLIVSAGKPEPARHAHHPLTSGHGLGRGVYLVPQSGSRWEFNRLSDPGGG